MHGTGDGQAPEQPPSVLDAVTAGAVPPYDDEDMVRYEVARQVLLDATGCFTGLIYEENRKAAPDHRAITRWEAGRAWCVQERRYLRIGDHEEVDRVIRQWGGFVRHRRERLRTRPPGSSRPARPPRPCGN